MAEFLYMLDDVVQRISADAWHRERGDLVFTVGAASSKEEVFRVPADTKGALLWISTTAGLPMSDAEPS